MAGSGKHDWELIAARDAFWGVVSTPEFRADKMDADAKRRFYDTGMADIAQVLAWFDADLGVRPSGRALDIGCGVGRLAFAMAKQASEVVGYDVAETMLAVARAAAPPNVQLTSSLPQGPFDWINSYIVFQHIPPAEGLALLDSCLALAAPRAFISLQITGWRDGALPSSSLHKRAARWVIRRVHRRLGRSADPLIRMHDYDFSEVLQRVTARGFERVVLRHTNHGGHHGVWMIARRS